MSNFRHSRSHMTTSAAAARSDLHAAGLLTGFLRVLKRLVKRVLPGIQIEVRRCGGDLRVDPEILGNLRDLFVDTAILTPACFVESLVIKLGPVAIGDRLESVGRQVDVQPDAAVARRAVHEEHSTAFLVVSFLQPVDIAFFPRAGFADVYPHVAFDVLFELLVDLVEINLPVGY